MRFHLDKKRRCSCCCSFSELRTNKAWGLRLIILSGQTIPGRPFGLLGVSKASLLEWGAAEVNIRRADTFLGRTQLNWIFLWDAIELEDWCMAPVSYCGRYPRRTCIYFVVW